MKRLVPLFYQLCLAYLLCCTACAEEEPAFPRLEIISPRSSPQLAFGDSLIVEFELRSAQSVNYRISIKQRPAAVQQRLLSNSNGRYRVLFIFNNKYLDSGTYTVQIRAENGPQSSSEFLEVFYEALPLRVKGAVSLSASQLHYAAAYGGLQQLALEDEYLFLEVIDAAGQAVLAAPQQHRLQALNLDDMQVAFSLPLPQPPGFGQYRGLLNFDRQLVTLEVNGQINRYDSTGLRSASVILNNNEIALTGATNAQKLAVISAAPGNPTKTLRIFDERLVQVEQILLGSGQFNICAYADGEWAIFKERSGDLELLIFDEVSNNLNRQFSLNAASVGLCQQAGAERVIFTTNGATYLFSPGVGVGPTQVLNFAVTDAEYNQVSDQILVLHAGAIHSLTTTNQLVYYAAAAVDAQNFEILYNK